MGSKIGQGVQKRSISRVYQHLVVAVAYMRGQLGPEKSDIPAAPAGAVVAPPLTVEVATTPVVQVQPQV